MLKMFPLLFLWLLAGCSKQNNTLAEPDTITLISERSAHHPASVSFQNEFGDYEHLFFNKDSVSGQY